jgi:hypothetical protein
MTRPNIQEQEPWAGCVREHPGSKVLVQINAIIAEPCLYNRYPGDSGVLLPYLDSWTMVRLPDSFAELGTIRGVCPDPVGYGNLSPVRMGFRNDRARDSGVD